MPRLGNRQIDAPDYASSARKVKDIPQQSLLHGLILTLDATFGVTGGDAAGSPYPDAMHRGVTQVGIVADGRQLVTLAGTTVNWIETFLYPGVRYQLAPSNDTAGLSEVVQLNMYIPFHIPRSFNEYECLLPTYATDSLQIQVDWAAASALINGGSGVKALTGATTKMREVPVDGLPLSPATLYGLSMWGNISWPVPAAASNQKIYLDMVQPGEEIRCIIIEAFDNGAVSDTLVTNLRLSINGKDELEQFTWNEFRSRNMANYGFSARKSGAIILDAAEDKVTSYGDLWSRFAGPRPYIEMTFAAPTSAASVLVSVNTIKRIPPSARM